MTLPSLATRLSVALLLCVQAASSQTNNRGLPPPGSPPLQPGQMGKPLTAEDKFKYRVTGAFGVRGLFGTTLASGVAQISDTPGEWGQDGAGFAQRFGAAFATNVSRQTFTFALESTLHQDPRYLPCGKTGFKARMLHALKSGYRTKGDNGDWQFAYSRYAGAFGAGFLANTWQPRGNDSSGDAAQRATYILLGDVGYNIVQEFVPFLRPKVGRYP